MWLTRDVAVRTLKIWSWPQSTRRPDRRIFLLLTRTVAFCSWSLNSQALMRENWTSLLGSRVPLPAANVLRKQSEGFTNFMSEDGFAICATGIHG